MFAFVQHAEILERLQKELEALRKQLQMHKDRVHVSSFHLITILYKPIRHQTVAYMSGGIMNAVIVVVCTNYISSLFLFVSQDKCLVTCCVVSLSLFVVFVVGFCFLFLLFIFVRFFWLFVVVFWVLEWGGLIALYLSCLKYN